jgi:cytochrome c553
LPAEKINHEAVYQDKVPAAISAAYGNYLATSCQGCHGQNFKGGPGHGKNEPDIPNITSTGKVGKWNEEQFIRFMRSGVTPEGKQVSAAMPWRAFTFTNDELKAISLHLHALK